MFGKAKFDFNEPQVLQELLFVADVVMNYLKEIKSSMQVVAFQVFGFILLIM